MVRGKKRVRERKREREKMKRKPYLRYVWFKFLTCTTYFVMYPSAFSSNLGRVRCEVPTSILPVDAWPAS